MRQFPLTTRRHWLLGMGAIVVSALIGQACQSSGQTREPSSNPAVAPPESTLDSTNLLSPAIVSAEVERSAEELWSLLRQTEDNRYAVLIRHATAPGTGDPPNFQLGDCSTQRNLSEAGRQQARQIGEAFRSRNVPVARVLSSQWCRCLETAELMNLGEVEPFPSLNSFFGDRSTADERTAQVQQFLLENQGVSGVIIMVTHQVNITALTDIFPQSGEAVIIQISDNNQFTILGQILVSQS